MNDAFIFQIHPREIETGFALSCEGILAKPLQVKRLYDAIIYAMQIGRDLEGELHLFDSSGRLAEVYALHPELPTFLTSRPGTGIGTSRGVS